MYQKPLYIIIFSFRTCWMKSKVSHKKQRHKVCHPFLNCKTMLSCDTSRCQIFTIEFSDSIFPYICDSISICQSIVKFPGMLWKSQNLQLVLWYRKEIHQIITFVQNRNSIFIIECLQQPQNVQTLLLNLDVYICLDISLHSWAFLSGNHSIKMRQIFTFHPDVL